MVLTTALRCKDSESKTEIQKKIKKIITDENKGGIGNI